MLESRLTTKFCLSAKETEANALVLPQIGRLKSKSQQVKKSNKSYPRRLSGVNLEHEEKWCRRTNRASQNQ
jgi:hypothetical protein